ncbi:MAG: hypothetical protein N3B21_03035 [Clostridia bacterium]|nr:hypothetical protein [Clostridia bacterium]
MKSYLQGSLLYRTVETIAGYYRTSVVKKIAGILFVWYNNSMLHEKFAAYMDRTSGADHSLFYKILRKAGRQMDSLVQAIHSFFAPCIRNSTPYRLWEAFTKEGADKSYRLLIVAISSYAIGYSLVITYRGMWGVRKLAVIAFLITVCAILSLAKDRWKLWLKKSMLYKFYRYILE